MPMAISFVGASIIWGFMYTYRAEGFEQIGFLNQVLVWFGLAPQQFLNAPPMNTFFSKFQIIAGGFSVGAGNVAILVLVCIMVAETVATFAWFLKWMGYCLPGEPSEEVAAGAPLPRAMAFVFIVLIIMVIVSGPLSASWIG